MRVIHNLGMLSINRGVNENAGFLLTNKKGGYCSFYNAPASRYQGMFCFDEKTGAMYKFIENIEVGEKSDATSLKNNFYSIERQSRGVLESFLMPEFHNSLAYWLNTQNKIDVILDCKESYDNREFGRHYDIHEEAGCVVIKFTKKTDAREDSTDGSEEFVLYLAIKSDSNGLKKNDRWIERRYPYDEARKSPPFKRHVYNAVSLKGAKFVFSVSKNKNSAIKECEYVFNNLEELKRNEENCFIDMLKKGHIKKIMQNQKISNEIRIAYINSVNSLNNLIADNKGNCGVFAGLPWFFQFWSRDALISLKALSKIDNPLAEKMLFGYLNKINNDGRLPNLTGKKGSTELGSADAHGWLFLRCNEIIEKIRKNKEIMNSIKESIRLIRQNKNSGSAKVKECLKKANLITNKKADSYHKMLYEIEGSLEKSIAGLLKHRTKNNFDVNSARETWMDTEFGNDGRGGARIEVQALRLNMYKLMFELTQDHKYRAMENILKNNVKESFWNGKILADGLNDFTIRPNLFIAAYAYPELLSNKEWETCFENALKGLWLEWGGLSTIDKNDPLFTDVSTGEDTKSYHRGDSWFWLNDLAALALNRINKNKFNKNIKKIIDASAEEILWKGCIGCHSELSSAKELQSMGCFNQAWSNAMFIELIDGVLG